MSEEVQVIRGKIKEELVKVGSLNELFLQRFNIDFPHFLAVAAFLINIFY